KDEARPSQRALEQVCARLDCLPSECGITFFLGDDSRTAAAGDGCARGLGRSCHGPLLILTNTYRATDGSVAEHQSAGLGCQDRQASSSEPAQGPQSGPYPSRQVGAAFGSFGLKPRSISSSWPGTGGTGSGSSPSSAMVPMLALGGEAVRQQASNV